MEEKKDEGHEQLVRDLQRLLQLATEKQFHDFENTKFGAPKVALVMKLKEISDRAKAGVYDN